MTTLVAFTVLVGLVGLERVAELVVSTRNAAWSKAQGGVETGLGHYPFMVVLHTGLLAGALVEAWVRRPDVPSALAWSMLLVVVLSQALRWWCIAILGRRWNTRVIVVPGLPTVPFILLSAFAAARGSRSLHAWLHAHPRFGPMIRDWETQGAVSRRAKRLATGMMAVCAVIMFLTAPALWMAATGAASCPVHA